MQIAKFHVIVLTKFQVSRKIWQLQRWLIRLSAFVYWLVLVRHFFGTASHRRGLPVLGISVIRIKQLLEGEESRVEFGGGFRGPR
jgi:hypothetical protein